MLRSLLSKRSVFALAVSAALMGCPDPDARMDDFNTRTAADREPAPPMGGEAPPPPPASRQDLTGAYVFSLSTALDATKPLMFKADVTSDLTAGTVALVLTPLRSWGCGGANAFCDDASAADFRELLTDDVIDAGTVPLDEDGKFVFDLGEVTVGGGVNAISGADITAELKLTGRTLEAGNFCGSVSGGLSLPFEFALEDDANSFGVVKLNEGDDIKAVNPISQCFEPAGGGDAAIDLTGAYMLSLSTALDATKPLLFKADMTSSDGMIAMVLTPLRSWGCGGANAFCDDASAADFRELQTDDVIDGGSVPIEDGKFVFDLGEVTVGGAVNAISGADITAELKLTGRTLGAANFCGSVSGGLSLPFEFALEDDANSFGVVAIPEGADISTLNPISQCF